MKYIKGNLLTELAHGRVEAIGHCCNCQQIMGSGIALSLKRAWSAVYKVDLDFEAAPEDRLGRMTFAEVEPGKFVYNLYGQLTFGSGRQVNYEAIYTALEKMRNHCHVNKITEVGFPANMASDRAGGSWVLILGMISEVFDNSGINVTIVEFYE